MRPDSRLPPSGRLIAVPIAILCACALVAIALILGGSGIDETSARVLGTAVSLAACAHASLLLGAPGRPMSTRPGTFAPGRSA